MSAQSALPTGWWIYLQNEYGTEAFWIARAEVPQADMANEYLETVADTAEGALLALRDEIDRAGLKPSHVDGVATPRGATSEGSLAEAWKAAQAWLAKEWWIAGIAGFTGTSDDAGWFASANGGPGSGYRGAQAIGETPEAALRALAATSLDASPMSSDIPRR
jgi:hypothetical protein